MPLSLTGSLVPLLAFVGGIGATELILILLVALIVLGPAKLPDVAKSIGKGMRELRRASDDLRDEIYSEVRDVKETVEKTAREVEEGTPAAKNDPYAALPVSDASDGGPAAELEETAPEEPEETAPEDPAAAPEDPAAAPEVVDEERER